MSYVAECKTCGVIKRGDLEEVGDAIEDHEQFHDVRIQRVATDGSGHVCEGCGETFRTLTRLRLHEKDDCPERQTYDQIDPDAANADLQAAEGLLTCRSCGQENPNADFEETPSFADGDYHLVVEFDCRHCGFENENRVVMEGVDREDLDRLPPHLRPDEAGGDLVTDGGSKLRCTSCRATVTLDDTLELQAPEISDGTIARVRVCEDCRPDAGNKRPVTAYKDLLKTVIKRANGIEEEQATLGEDEWDPETAELRDGETTDIDSHARRNAEHLRMAKEHLEDDDDLATDGGRDQDDTGFFVVNEDRGAVVAGPFDVKETAAEKALDRGPSHIVATEAVLEMIEVTSSTTIRWENEDVDVVTDGGQDVRSEWRLVCTDCNFEDDLVTEGHPREGPPSEVEDRVREHKGTVDWSHVVRVEGRVADEEREIDPSLLTDGGQSVNDTERSIKDIAHDYLRAVEGEDEFDDDWPAKGGGS